MFIITIRVFLLLSKRSLEICTRLRTKRLCEGLTVLYVLFAPVTSRPPLSQCQWHSQSLWQSHATPPNIHTFSKWSYTGISPVQNHWLRHILLICIGPIWTLYPIHEYLPVIPVDIILSFLQYLTILKFIHTVWWSRVCAL